MAGTDKATTFPANLVAISDEICGELYSVFSSCCKIKKEIAAKSVGMLPSFE